MNLPRASLFNYESLDMLWGSIGNSSQKLWPFQFARGFLVPFWVSQVTTIQIFDGLPFSIFSISIYYGPQPDIQVKSYANLIWRGAPFFNFERLNILWASIGQPIQMLWPFEFSCGFLFNFDRLDILWVSIKHPNQKLRPFEFVWSFLV